MGNAWMIAKPIGNAKPMVWGKSGKSILILFP